MPADFDWQAEDDRTWREYRTVAPADGRRTARRRRARLAAVAAVAAVLLTVATLQVRRLVDAAASAAEQEIRAGHELVQLAVAQEDVELLASLLLPEDASWAQAQVSLLDQGLFLDRQAFGLAAQPIDGPVPLEIDLSADLAAAEVTAAFPYEISAEGRLPERVRLLQTLLFRRERERWLLAPPGEDFWGPQMTSRGRFLTAHFRERDAAVGNRLAGDLEAAIAQACNTIAGLDCGDDLHIELSLATDPATLLESERLGWVSGEVMALPSPTLVGLPADEGGYRALFRGYAARLLEGFLNRPAAGCCPPALLQQALVDAQLRQLGLRPWPLAAEAYGDLFRDGADLERLRPLWAAEAGAAGGEIERTLAYALVEYLLTVPGNPPAAELQRRLAASRSLEEWLGEGRAATGSLGAALEQGWRRYVRSKVVIIQPSPPDLPDQDVLLMCSNASRGTVDLFRFNPDSSRWSVELGDRQFAVMDALPNGRGALLTEDFVGADMLRTTVFLDGRETVLTMGDTFYRAAGRHDPSGRYTAVVLEGPASAGGSSIALLDTASCGPGGCAIEPVAGTPLWSPDGAATILVAPAGAQTLYLAGPQGESPRALGQGREPFWLDSETFGYLRGRETPEIVLATRAGEGEMVIPADLFAAANPTGEPAQLTLTHAIARPGKQPLLFVTANDRRASRDYLFVYDPAAGQMTMPLVVEQSLDGLGPVELSPDGRWLLAMGTGQRGASGLWARDLYLVEAAEEGRVLTLHASQAGFLPIHDWSADGRWLLQLGVGFLVLHAPDADYQHLINHDLSDCTAAIWVNRD